MNLIKSIFSKNLIEDSKIIIQNPQNVQILDDKEDVPIFDDDIIDQVQPEEEIENNPESDIIDDALNSDEDETDDQIESEIDNSEFLDDDIENDEENIPPQMDDESDESLDELPEEIPQDIPEDEEIIPHNIDQTDVEPEEQPYEDEEPINTQDNEYKNKIDNLIAPTEDIDDNINQMQTTLEPSEHSEGGVELPDEINKKLDELNPPELVDIREPYYEDDDESSKIEDDYLQQLDNYQEPIEEEPVQQLEQPQEEIPQEEQPYEDEGNNDINIPQQVDNTQQVPQEIPLGGNNIQQPDQTQQMQPPMMDPYALMQQNPQMMNQMSQQMGQMQQQPQMPIQMQQPMQQDPNMQMGQQIPPQMAPQQPMMSSQAPNIDPNTGQPIIDPNAQMGQQMPPQIDPNTGMPIQQPQIDPNTGQPIGPPQAPPLQQQDPNAPPPDPNPGKLGNAGTSFKGPAVPLDELGRINQLKLINKRLTTIKHILEDKNRSEYRPISRRIDDTLEYFKYIITNLDSFVQYSTDPNNKFSLIDELIQKFKRFIFILLIELKNIDHKIAVDEDDSIKN